MFHVCSSGQNGVFELKNYRFQVQCRHDYHSITLPSRYISLQVTRMHTLNEEVHIRCKDAVIYSAFVRNEPDKPSCKRSKDGILYDSNVVPISME